MGTYLTIAAGVLIVCGLAYQFLLPLLKERAAEKSCDRGSIYEHLIALVEHARETGDAQLVDLSQKAFARFTALNDEVKP